MCFQCHSLRFIFQIEKRGQIIKQLKDNWGGIPSEILEPRLIKQFLIEENSYKDLVQEIQYLFAGARDCSLRSMEILQLTQSQEASASVSSDTGTCFLILC